MQLPASAPASRLVEIAGLGERLSALRLCDADALAAVRRSLEQHGQLAALTLFVEPHGLKIIDGFQRVRAARALGWSTLLARVDELPAIDAKLRQVTQNAPAGPARCRRVAGDRRQAAPPRAAPWPPADRARGGLAGALALPRGWAIAAGDRAAAPAP